ncbi:hypothetical protein F4802DRAFT_519168 [Xylaria palmicola]|nr:hypothetical protein F4802DRAFT_519168 [Xylaria palmicola]
MASRARPSRVRRAQDVQTAALAKTTLQQSQQDVVIEDEALDGEDDPAPGKWQRSCLRMDLRPVTNVHQAFKEMLSTQKSELIAVANDGGFQLRVATMCSGTEAPVFALKLIKELSQWLTNGRPFVEFEHLFSVEIEPFKQSYISRNAPGSIVFRDVVDFADPDAKAAPTIWGHPVVIPGHIDLLVAGTSCVDFSTLNSSKKKNMDVMSTGARLSEEWKEWKKSNGSLRATFFNEVREWLNSITPAEIQTAGNSMGESSLTFLSVICYLNRHPVKMVVFENVTNAPWATMTGLFLHAIGYAARHILVDTKDYYIPQTRKRGYVVAVDRKVFGDSADHILDAWEAQLNLLKRSPSAPVQDWLLSSHDPLTIRARQDESEKAVANGLNPGKDSQWDRSKMRHARVRRNLPIGNERPLTAWGLGGTEKPYDRFDKLITKTLNDRALDCIELLSFLCLVGKTEVTTGPAKGKVPPTGPLRYDIKFKSQVFDLSQNIDRGPINRNFGITGCLTPRGMNLITDQGRLVSGFEALNLQGLPLRDLDLTRESQDELRDLAGNAMTTTVVGAVLFSLLLAVHRRCGNVKPRPLNAVTSSSQAAVSYHPLYQPLFMEVTPEGTWTTSAELFRNVQEVINLSKRCRRYCYCNGGAKYSTDELVWCQDCNITRCTSCAGNPEHRFGPPMSIQDPIMNDMAPREMMAHFPVALTSIISNEIDHIPFRRDFPGYELQSLLLSSLRSVTFYYSRVLISETVTICYSAKDQNWSFDLQAVISDKAITWYLFLDPWSNFGQKLIGSLQVSAVQLSRPFGRAQLYEHAPAFVPQQSAWEFWQFDDFSFDVEVTRPCPESIEIKMIPLAEIPAMIHADVQSIEGIYYHRPKCDAAEDSLHVSIQDPKRYLFKDPSRFGPPQDDCYIISDCCRFLDRHEFRDFTAKFSPLWEPRAYDTRVTLTIGGYWQKAVAYCRPGRATAETILVSCTKQAGSHSIPHRSEFHLNEGNHRVRTLASVCIISNEFADEYMALSKYEGADPEQWARVARPDHSPLFDLFAPVNVNLSGTEFNVRDFERTVQSNQEGDCELCLPRLPDVHWMEKTTEGAKIRGVHEPYRLSGEMLEYEKKLHQCQEPVQIAINIKSVGNQEGLKEVTANYEVNVEQLVHRARDYLTRLRNGSAGHHKVTTFVDIKKESLNIPNLKFESFRKSLRRLPASISLRSISASDIFINGHALTQQQEISLQWMLDREMNPPLFTEREVEECWFDPLNLRIIGGAERVISRAGGILADQVGYGKTVVTLALIVAQQAFDRTTSLQMRSAGQNDTQPLIATLVVTPAHLVDQWASEVKKFVGWSDEEVLIIKTYRDLQGRLKPQSGSGTSRTGSKRARTAKTFIYLIDHIKKARIIIVSTAVFEAAYFMSFGMLAGSLAAPQSIPKDTANPNARGGMQDWYEGGLMHVRKHVGGFKPEVFNLSRLETIERRRKSQQDLYGSLVADHYDTSTRIGLETVRNDKTGNFIKGSKAPATVHKEYSDTARANVLTEKHLESDKVLHVLEAFSYARVIYDEFSYENFAVALFVKNVKAHAKWVLSATPLTGNLRALCEIGMLLDVHIARPIKQRPGLPLIAEGPFIFRQNATEKQLSYSKSYSDKSICERVEQAHKFLQHFASANPFDEEGLGKITVFEKVYCSYMTRRELIKYLDLEQDLRNYDLDVSAQLLRHRFGRDILDNFPSDGRLCAGLALVAGASVDHPDADDWDVDTLISSRKENLRVAQDGLSHISKVAIWLVIRRSKEKVKKKNDSATSAVEDLAWYFESILEGNSEVFGGREALEAVSKSIFDANKYAECSEWLKRVDRQQRKSEDYFTEFFALLEKHLVKIEWAQYFQRPVQDAGPEILDVYNHLKAHTTSPQQHPRGNAVEQKSPTHFPADSSHVGQKSGPAKPAFPQFNRRKKIRGGDYTETESELTDIMLKLEEAKSNVFDRARQVTTAKNLFCAEAERECNACGRPCDDTIHFISECGHFVCSSHPEVKFCGQIKSDKFQGGGSGCPALIRQRSIPLNQVDLCTMSITPSFVYSLPGKEPPVASSKSWAILRTINSILQSSNDRILLFYQLGGQKKEVCCLLEYFGILYNEKPATGAAASITENSSSTRRTPDDVRILELNSVAAAGSNFQDANHVIFISTPAFRKQEDFEKYTRQAKGRVLRHGQRKNVHIYYFVTANTFEVDLLQLRTRSHIRLEAGNEVNSIPVATLVPLDANTHHNAVSDGDAVMTDGQAVSS